MGGGTRSALARGAPTRSGGPARDGTHPAVDLEALDVARGGCWWRGGGSEATRGTESLCGSRLAVSSGAWQPGGDSERTCRESILLAERNAIVVSSVGEGEFIRARTKPSTRYQIRQSTGTFRSCAGAYESAPVAVGLNDGSVSFHRAGESSVGFVIRDHTSFSRGCQC